MPFRLRKDARKWFGHIRGSLDIDFDVFYFCLIAGLVSRKKEKVADSQTTELVDYFPEVYRDKSRLIVALFLSRELMAMRIRLEDRNALNEQITQLVDPDSSSKLSAEGMKEVNKYSSGGFEVLTEWFEDEPLHLETFLLSFKEKLDEAVAKDAQQDADELSGG